MSSTPTLTEFSPDHIKYQRDVIDLIENFDYSQGVLEILLSGSVGSAKSILAAHLAVVHCLRFPKSRVLLGRKALPDLKDTIFTTISEHIEESLIEGKDYHRNFSRGYIRFSNGSEIVSRSWVDQKYRKLRSLAISAAIIEELTENSSKECEMFYPEMKMRVGRLPHVSQTWIINCTNPDDPGHWAYGYFIRSKSKTRRVFYSVTTDNPFLPESYIKQLKEDLDPRQAQRMLEGKWIRIADDVIYHAYDPAMNFRHEKYKIDEKYPIIISWDFNIGEGKPLSCVLMQYVDDTFHIFNEIVIEGMRTLGSCDELAERGHLSYNTTYTLTGDASGRARDTRNIKSDYDIIKNFFSNYQKMRQKEGIPLKFEMRVPSANPAVRTRHNLVNAYCLNAAGKRRLFVYEDAKTADKGLQLTKLKKGGSYIEDDSAEYQHITTAIGYAIHTTTSRRKIKPQGTVRL